jgi:hypothetical protein
MPFATEAIRVACGAASSVRMRGVGGADAIGLLQQIQHRRHDQRA